MGRPVEENVGPQHTDTKGERLEVGEKGDSQKLGLERADSPEVR